MTSTTSSRARRRTGLLVSLLLALTGLQAVITTTPATAAGEVLSHVGSAGSAGNRTSHPAVVPTQVQAGDLLLLTMTWNNTSAATAPAGWTQLQARDGSQVRGRVWTRVATASDAGRTVTVTTGASAKSVVSLSAYRSSGGAVEVSASAIGGSNTSATVHTTPQVPVTQPGSWLVSTWSVKGASAPTWTLPAGVTTRTQRSATGTGLISMVSGDSATPVTAGTGGGLSATTSIAAGRSVQSSVVVVPTSATGPANTPPVADFSSSCVQLVCGFDAGGSTDADGDPLTYAWAFGDSQTGTGVSPSHTYSSAGTRTVTLTVSDGVDSDQATGTVSPTAAPPGSTPQPSPGLTRLVPETANTAMPRITGGEIWDIEVVGSRAYVAGTFTSVVDVAGNGATIGQAKLLAFDLGTGLVDRSFRPVFTGGSGGVDTVEATPDGTKLYVAGSFNEVNGVTKRKVARLDPATGAAVAGFQANVDSRATALAASDSTVYVGGRFSAVNGQTMVGLAAVDATTGALDRGFDNQLAGGIGVNGVLQVQSLKLTHDNSTLLVVHTARRIDGQDRYGVGLIDTASKQLLPWYSRLWEDNLQYVGGIQRIYAGDIAPDDSYFVVTSGSGGDRPPINDTAIAFPLEGGDDVQPLWISRAFDSIYSVAITESAVYLGGHFQWNESPTAPDPWPGLDNVGYGTGQGLSGYGLGDAVVRRDHLGALNPVDGKALEWHPGSNSFEGNKAMIATSRGLLTGGDTLRQGGSNVGRVAFFDVRQAEQATPTQTTIDAPIQGRVVPAGDPVEIRGTATSTTSVGRVQVEVQSGSAYLQDNLTTWSTTFNTIDANLAAGTTSRDWSLTFTPATAREMVVRARAVSGNGQQDPTKATKKIESFSLDDLPPETRITAPSSLQTSTSFVIRGTATDDKGITAVNLYIRDVDTDRYLDADGTLNDGYTTFRIEPDVDNATSTTWEHEVTLPYEGNWKIGAAAVDTLGQSDSRWVTAEVTVDSSGAPPTVTVAQPVSVVPPVVPPTLTMAPGNLLTFSGSATDDESLASVEVSFRNTTTRENLAADGSWGSDVIAGWYKVSPANLSQANLNWSFQSPEPLVPGTYDFRVRATDHQDLTTSSSLQGRVVINVAVPGDAAPNTLQTQGLGELEVRRLDLVGTATDDRGVREVRVAVYENDTDLYLRPDGTLRAGYGTLPAVLGTPDGTSTSWTLSTDVPANGRYSITAVAVDTSGQLDPSSSGATATYRIYPGDADPVLLENLSSPSTGDQFTDSRIFVSGRAEDDLAIAAVEVAVVDSAGRYMSSNGSFGSTERWVSAFLNSPGSLGSNYSYTTPLLQNGTYEVRVRPVDNHGNRPAYRSATVGVTAPAANQPPVAVGSVTCEQNVCTFDGRSSTDENRPTLAYSWAHGDGRTGTGALRTYTYTRAGTFTPTLTVTDEYGLAASTTLPPVTITEPTGNVAPSAVITTPTCVGLTCAFSGATSTDPNTGDTISYAWTFGDGGTSTSSGPSRTYAAAGTYTVTLTVTDGWGRSSVTSRTVTVAP